MIVTYDVLEQIGSKAKHEARGVDAFVAELQRAVSIGKLDVPAPVPSGSAIASGAPGTSGSSGTAPPAAPPASGSSKLEDKPAPPPKPAAPPKPQAPTNVAARRMFTFEGEHSRR